MKVLAISLFLLGIIVALFSKQIDQLAKRHLSIKYLLIVIMTGPGLCGHSADCHAPHGHGSKS